ncbi:response regulator [Candidatus Nitrospira allomarina]|uniref:Response regulator n=1 Tax=Candidatus Nitrospira allomarina TaxID=3020900 RepID=A0AA96GAQ2_9BACT|nr:response regulator [Candidatus Nitrospira allomarina]WNM56495.1 response regulator [Candidatus Nitrospira allomarina]
MINTPNQPILLVEDSPEDYEVATRSLRAAGLKNPIQRCSDGDEALDYLYRRGIYQDPHTSLPPGIILLDLNMPGTDGREVLQEIKQDPQLKLIPIIVLSTSADERDIQDCYAMGANSYVPKPLNFEGFLQAMTRLKDFWFEVVIIPKVTEEV